MTSTPRRVDNQQSTVQLQVLPGLLEEETVASYLHRVALHNSVADSREANLALLGAAWRKPDLLLPTGLRRLAQITTREAHFGSLHSWITDHTHFGYFAAHASADVARRLRHRLEVVQVGAVRPTVALSAREWTRNTGAFCPVCDDEALRHYGFSFARRIASTPYVARCPEHDAALADSTMRSGVRWRGTVATTNARDGRSANDLRFAQESALLLRAKPCVLRPEFYAALGGVVPPDASFRHRSEQLAWLLAKRFSAGFGCPVFSKMLVDQDMSRSLARRALSSRSACVHPVLAILIRILYADGVAARSPTKRRDDKEAEVQRAVVITAEDLREIGEGASARSVARKLGVDAQTVIAAAHRAGVQVRSRAKKVDARLEGQVIESLAAGLSAVQSALANGLSFATVYRIRAKHQERIAQLEETANDVALRRHQSEWLAMIKGRPQAPRAALQRAAPALYSWLYRNCRQWLLQNPPAEKRPKTRVNRETRAPRVVRADLHMVFRAAAAELLAAEGRPIRVTWKRLCAAVGIESDMAIGALTQPLRHAFEALVEDEAHFVTRRVHWAVKELTSNGQALQMWRVQKALGLRTSTIERSGVDIEKLVQSISESSLMDARDEMSMA